MKTYKLTTIAVLAFFILSGIACKKNDATTAKASTVSIYLTDDPSLIFDNLFIDIQKVEVKAENDSEAEIENQHEAEHDDSDKNGSTSGGWIALNIQPGIYDLLKLRNGLDTILGTANFSGERNLKKMRITLGPNNSAVLNGITIPLVIKNKNNILVVKLEEAPFLSGDGRFQLSFHIDAGRSVRQNGNEFELIPQAGCFNRAKSGSIEGRVLPVDAHALVFAVNGTDTASAMPEAEGLFKIVGLKDGNYTLLFHATANNYLDTTVNVIVAGEENTHIDAVTLHK